MKTVRFIGMALVAISVCIRHFEFRNFGLFLKGI